jgi:uncharacterized protein (TIGR04255 family)
MSGTRPSDLPDYENPPLNEVLLSLQFAQPKGFGNIYAGLLWQQFKDKFPKYQEQPSIPPVFEVFGPNPATTPPFQISMGVPSLRYWFFNENEVIQVQSDRFIHNWRKTESEEEYPHYELIQEKFRKAISIFETFLRDNSLGELRPNQCEIAYINQIDLPDDMNPHENLQKIFRFLNESLVPVSSLKFEDSNIQMRYIIEDGNEKLGRIHIHIMPALRITDQKPIIQLSLTVRGKPKEETIESVFNFFDQGRSLIVKSFDSLTTPEMHVRWRKKL